MTSASRAVRPSGRACARQPATAGTEHGIDRLGVEPAVASLGGEQVRGVFRQQGRPMGPRLGQCVRDVRRSEQPRRWRQGARTRAAVVARSVQTFVVAGARVPQRREERRPAEHTLRVVRVEAHLLPVVLAERPGR